MKALAAGKHVLLEKPSADTAEETRKMFELADKKGLVLLEAFHYRCVPPLLSMLYFLLSLPESTRGSHALMPCSRFHPAAQRIKEIVSSGSLGPIKSIHTSLALPSGVIKDNDIRLSYGLGGGSLMDCGCYAISFARYLAGADPIRITSATADTDSKLPKVDIGASADLVFPGATEGGPEIEGRIESQFRLPGWGPFGLLPRIMPVIFGKVVCEEGEVELTNFVFPWVYHSLTVKGKDGKSRTEKVYGIPGWTT